MLHLLRKEVYRKPDTYEWCERKKHAVLESFQAKLFSYSVTAIKGKYCSFLFQKYPQLKLDFCLQQLVSPPACWCKVLSMFMLFFLLYAIHILMAWSKRKKRWWRCFKHSPWQSEKLSNGRVQHWGQEDTHEYNGNSFSLMNTRKLAFCKKNRNVCLISFFYVLISPFLTHQSPASQV